MRNLSVWQLLVLTFGIYLALPALVYAGGTGIEIIEFTGGATQLFGAMRATTFVRIVAVVLFALAIIAGFGGYISGGWTAVLAALLLIGGWMGAEPIVDTIYASGAVI